MNIFSTVSNVLHAKAGISEMCFQKCSQCRVFVCVHFFPVCWSEQRQVVVSVFCWLHVLAVGAVFVRTLELLQSGHPHHLHCEVLPLIVPCQEMLVAARTAGELLLTSFEMYGRRPCLGTCPRQRGMGSNVAEGMECQWHSYQENVSIQLWKSNV